MPQDLIHDRSTKINKVDPDLCHNMVSQDILCPSEQNSLRSPSNLVTTKFVHIAMATKIWILTVFVFVLFV